MMWWVVSVITIYSLLKLCHVFIGPRHNFGHTEQSTLEILRSGEPMIAITAILVSLIVVLYPLWFTTRLSAREVGHSAICYGRLAASSHLPSSVYDHDREIIDLSQKELRWNAVEHAPSIIMSRDTIDTLLDGSRLHYEVYYQKIASSHDGKHLSQELHFIKECLNDNWEAHGDIFNP